MRDMFRGRDREAPPPGLAGADAARFTEEAIRLLEDAEGTGWYELPGNQIDAAVVALCRLRRAGAGQRSGIEAGDQAVRNVLEQAKPEAVIWLASRLVSYVDENGFPEQMERFLDRG